MGADSTNLALSNTNGEYQKVCVWVRENFDGSLHAQVITSHTPTKVLMDTFQPFTGNHTVSNNNQSDLNTSNAQSAVLTPAQEKQQLKQAFDVANEQPKVGDKW